MINFTKVKLVQALVQKLKHAQNLVLGSREAYLNLTKSAFSIDIDEWKRGEQQAQKNWVKDGVHDTPPPILVGIWSV